MIYLTSDYHLCHKNVIKYCSRPFTNTFEMNEQLIANHNATVTSEDKVYFLGDFIFSGNTKHKEFLNRLSGYKILIVGNHDKKNESLLLSLGWNEVYPSPINFQYSGINFKLSHYPHRPDNILDEHKAYYNRHPYLIKDDSYDWLLCGHVHEKWKILDNAINVGVDVWNFKPISIDFIINNIINKDNFD